MSEETEQPVEPNRTMDSHFFKGLVANTDQQGSGTGDLPNSITESYRGFLRAGCDREDAIDLSVRFWARLCREYRS